MPRGNEPQIARAELYFGTVVHSHLYPSREDMDEVANLATIGSNNWFDTLRPAPSRLICDPDGLGITQFHHLYFALFKETYFLRSIKALLYHFCHIEPQDHSDAWLVREAGKEISQAVRNAMRRT